MRVNFAEYQKLKNQALLYRKNQELIKQTERKQLQNEIVKTTGLNPENKKENEGIEKLTKQFEQFKQEKLISDQRIQTLEIDNKTLHQKISQQDQKILDLQNQLFASHNTNKEQFKLSCTLASFSNDLNESGVYTKDECIKSFNTRIKNNNKIRDEMIKTNTQLIES